MNMLFQAIDNQTTTENGLPANKSTLNKCLDLFFVIGTARGADMTQKFSEAFAEDADLALRILQWSRDVRGGAGERERFRSLLKFIASETSEVPEELIRKLIAKVPEIGRFDDLFSLIGTPYQNAGLDTIARAITAGNGLAAKWAPRKGPRAELLRKHMGFSPKRYRKTIVGLTTVVETQMCAKEWDKIEFQKVPSVASRIYAKAFGRNDEERYKAYLEAVIEGKAKMNASAIFPHDVLKNVYSAPETCQAQWGSLPNYIGETGERIIPVVDVSGSMHGLPMEIAIALGLYFSERLPGEFKDCVITFEEKPQFVKLRSELDIVERYNAVKRLPWGGSTDFLAVFGTILAAAIQMKLKPEQMPTMVLCVSDMQFNQAGGNNYERAIDRIRAMYKDTGYEMPKLVFWNVSSRDTGNVPVTYNEAGTALVSGASPAIIKTVLSGELNPVDIMTSAVSIDRYTL